MKFLIAGALIAIAFVSVESSFCVPGVVPNIILYGNYNLYWSEALNPNKCIINYYVINVFDSEDGTELQFQTTRGILNYNVNFLDMCKSYRFEVHALSNQYVLGPSDQYVTTTLPLSNINLTLASLNTSVGVNEIDLTWNISSEVHKCISYYRVVYWDESNMPTDVYVTQNAFSLKGEIPCMSYTFQVNAIIANPDIQGPIIETVARAIGEEPSVPSLVSLATTNNSVNMIWKLEPYAQNHCNLSYISVNTLGAPANISSIRIPITDNKLRPNVNVTLTGLSHDNVYISDVNVVNTAGVSRNVTVTYQT